MGADVKRAVLAVMALMMLPCLAEGFHSSDEVYNVTLDTTVTFEFIDRQFAYYNEKLAYPRGAYESEALYKRRLALYKEDLKEFLSGRYTVSGVKPDSVLTDPVSRTVTLTFIFPHAVRSAGAAPGDSSRFAVVVSPPRTVRSLGARNLDTYKDYVTGDLSFSLARDGSYVVESVLIDCDGSVMHEQ